MDALWRNVCISLGKCYCNLGNLFKKLSKNPTEIITKKISKLITTANAILETHILNNLEEHYSSGYIYGNPKIHSLINLPISSSTGVGDALCFPFILLIIAHAAFIGVLEFMALTNFPHDFFFASLNIRLHTAFDRLYLILLNTVLFLLTARSALILSLFAFSHSAFHYATGGLLIFLLFSRYGSICSSLYLVCNVVY